MPPMPSETPANEPNGAASRLKRWAILALKVGVTVLALWLTWRLLSDLDWGDLARRVGSASPLYLALAVGGLLLRFAFWAWRFRLAAAGAVARVPGSVLGFFVLHASAAFNLITPTARFLGGVLRARYFAAATGNPFGVLYGVVLYDQLAHQAAIWACTGLAVVAWALYVGRTALGFGALGVLVAAAVLLILWGRRGRSFEANPLVRRLAQRAERAEGRMQRLYSHGHEAVDVFLRLLGSPALRGEVFLLGVGYFLANAAAQWFVFLALGERVDPLVVYAGVALGGAFGGITGTPGGLGTTEAAMVATFAALGVGEVEAAAGTLLFRGLHYIVVLALGLPAFGLLELKYGSRGREAGETET